jgi:hypothetical protein
MARPCWVCHLQVSQIVAPYARLRRSVVPDGDGDGGVDASILLPQQGLFLGLDGSERPLPRFRPLLWLVAATSGGYN